MADRRREVWATRGIFAITGCSAAVGVILYVVAMIKLYRQKGKFGDSLWQMLHFYFISFLLTIIGTGLAFHQVFFDDSIIQIPSYQSVNVCYFSTSPIVMILSTTVSAMGFLAMSRLWISVSVVKKRSLPGSRKVNAVCIAASWGMSVAVMVMIFLTMRPVGEIQFCLIAVAMKPWAFAVMILTWITTLILSLLSSLYNRWFAQKKLMEFAINRAQIPLAARMELQHSIKLTDLALPGLIIQTIFFLLGFMGGAGITSFCLESSLITKSQFSLLFSLLYLVPIITTQSVQPLLVLWQVNKMDREEKARLRESAVAVHQMNAQMLRSWKVTPRSAVVRQMNDAVAPVDAPPQQPGMSGHVSLRFYEGWTPFQRQPLPPIGEENQMSIQEIKVTKSMYRHVDP